MKAFIAVAFLALGLPITMGAQQPSNCMPGMRMPGCPDPSGQPSVGQPTRSGQAPDEGGEGTARPQAGKTGLMSMPGMEAQNFLESIAHHTTSGTTSEPNSTPAPMIMVGKGHWMFMFHANVFILNEQQSGPRGADKLFSVNWFMPMAQRELGRGILTVRAMVSLEPMTVTGRRYPLLFQQGETAFGRPIVDGQHPHDFIMELAALYDLKLSNKTLLSFYFAPIGDPALGPAAYPHRASAAENPVGTLGHHQEDSTHIAADVVTVGLAHGIARVEASGFHGREPDEFRWDINQGKIDSWSARLTVQPGKNWSGQYSYGRIKSPEALFPAEDQERMTTSLMYNRPIQNGNWASTFAWGRTRSLQDNAIFNSYLLESTIRFRNRNHIWTRIENAERSNELVIGENGGENPLPAGFEEKPFARVQAYTLGYDRDFDLIPHLASAVGVQCTAYGVLTALKPIYGSHPIGAVIFLRLRPFSGTER